MKEYLNQVDAQIKYNLMLIKHQETQLEPSIVRTSGNERVSEQKQTIDS